MWNVCKYITIDLFDLESPIFHSIMADTLPLIPTEIYEKLLLPMNAYELSYAESGKVPSFAKFIPRMSGKDDATSIYQRWVAQPQD